MYPGKVVALQKNKLLSSKQGKLYPDKDYDPLLVLYKYRLNVGISLIDLL